MEDEITASVVGVLFGLEGFRLLTAVEVAGELELLVETTAELVGCPDCGAVAAAKHRQQRLDALAKPIRHDPRRSHTKLISNQDRQRVRDSKGREEVKENPT